MTTADRPAVLERRVAQSFSALAAPDSHCLIAVSGGGDSMALLELLHRTQALHRCWLSVGHVDHGIAPDSAAVAELVVRSATERELPACVRRLELGRDASETRARTARRAALQDIAEQTGSAWIVLAHHADDQAETVLMRVLRGSGPIGLAAMAPRRGRWLRPLLGLRRAELAEYLGSRQITAWVDPANSDPRHLRSWLRSAVLPALRTRLPSVDRLLVGVAAHASAARDGWDDVAALIPALDLRDEPHGISVAASVLRGYRSPLRHAILAALGRRCGVPLGRRRLAAIDRLLASADGGGVIDLSASVRAELGFGRLVFLRVCASDTREVSLSLESSAQVGAARFDVQATCSARVARAGWQTVLVPGRYLAREWRSGDRIRPLGGRGSRAVAVLLREAGVTVTRRRAWPVVVNADDATIVWVPGICRADALVPPEGTQAWRVDCAVT